MRWKVAGLRYVMNVQQGKKGLLQLLREVLPGLAFLGHVNHPKQKKTKPPNQQMLVDSACRQCSARQVGTISLNVQSPRYLCSYCSCKRDRPQVHVLDGTGASIACRQASSLSQV